MKNKMVSKLARMLVLDLDFYVTWRNLGVLDHDARMKWNQRAGWNPDEEVDGSLQPLGNPAQINVENQTDVLASDLSSRRAQLGPARPGSAHAPACSPAPFK